MRKMITMVELRQKYTIRLRQEALENGFLRFLRGKTQCLQLQQLVPSDLADGGLVDQLASGQLAVMAGMDSMWACPMMMESHCTWPKQAALPTILG